MSRFILLEDAKQFIESLRTTYNEWEQEGIFSESEIAGKMATLNSVESHLNLIAISNINTAEKQEQVCLPQL